MVTEPEPRELDPGDAAPKLPVSMVSLTKRTEPSTSATFTPPG